MTDTPETDKPENAASDADSTTDIAPASVAPSTTPPPAAATTPAPGVSAAFTGTTADASTAPAPHKKSNTAGLVAALAVGALIGGVSGAGVSVWAVTSNMNNRTTASAPVGPATITVNDAANATKITAIAATAGPSVVTVSVSGDSAAGTGSGVILTEDGYILTNTHVVTLDGETAHPTISVQSYDGHLYTAKLIGTDPITDLAVIKISGTFQPLEFADSSKLNVGDDAVAIGAPLGLSNTVTSGIVSALNRSITVSSSAAPQDGTGQTPNDNNGSGPFNFWEFPGPGDNGQGNNGQQQAPQSAAQQANIFLPVIQTDAAINPGNSGGALLDLDGKVIGINVAIAGTGSTTEGQSGSIGVGFAIPSNLAKRVAFDIINGGKATHGLLGATVMDVMGDSAITDKTVVGASVQSVTDGGAAQKAGIRKGDIVTGFNGLPITSSTDLTAQVRAAEAGSQATVTYVRGGQSTTVTVTLGELK
jgi:putative serine protease PepD